MIELNELEVLRECRYSKKDIGCVSDNAYMSIVLTNNCQKNCWYCINSNTDRRLYMPIDKALNNIRQAVEKYDIKEAVILGGEPTMHPQLFEFIEGLKSVGLKRFGITTNGIKMSKDEEFANKLLMSGLSWINISIDSDDDFDSMLPLLKRIRTMENAPKIRINTNVYKDNHDSDESLIRFLEIISLYCDEIRVSNIIAKDSFSVNTVLNNDDRILSREQYIELFTELMEHYAENYTIIHNHRALGFVDYYLIPKKTPIIVNWNLDSDVSKQVCENDLEERQIHTFKCLVTGDISLSWNQNNIIAL